LPRDVSPALCRAPESGLLHALSAPSQRRRRIFCGYPAQNTGIEVGGEKLRGEAEEKVTEAKVHQ